MIILGERSEIASRSTWLKAGYGFGEVGLSSMELMLQVYLLELYVRAGLSPFAAGIALATAAIWDAVSDPLMGSISDKTPSATPRGKRLGYFIPGVILAAVTFVVLFSPSFGSSQTTLFVRLIVSYVILNTALTLANVPYLALINDLASNAKDRAGFFGWRLGFSGFGLLLGLALPTIVSSAQGRSFETSEAESFLQNREIVAYCISGAVLISCLLAAWTLWKPSGVAFARPFYGLGVRAAAGIAIRSKSFRNIVIAFVFISLGRALNGSLALLFYKGTLNFAESQVAFGLIGLAIVIIVSTPIWIWMAKKTSKANLCFWGSVALTLTTAIAYPIMPEERIGPLIVVVILGGVSVASVVLLESLFSDVIEADSDESKSELTGAYYGLWRLATKLARAGGLGLSGVFLGMIGFREGIVEQSYFIERGIAWAFGPGVAFFFGLGSLFIWLESKKQ